MKIAFLKIKENSLAQYITDCHFRDRKLGYCSHYKDNHINFYTLTFGSWFNKWFLECIEVVIRAKDNLPRITIAGPKHIFWWFLKTSKNKNDFSYKRFQITKNNHVCCGYFFLK